MPQIVSLPIAYGPDYAGAQMNAGMAQNADFQKIGIARDSAEANAAEDKRRGDLFAARDQFERDRVAKTDKEKEDAKAAAAKLDAMGIAMAKMGKRPAGAAQRPGFAPGIGQIPTADARSNQLVRRWDAASDDYLKEALSHLSVLPPEMAAAYREQIMQHARERGNVNDLIQLKGRRQELADQGMFMGAKVDLAGQVSAYPDPELEGRSAALDAAIEAGSVNYEQAQAETQAILGEAARRRGNAQTIAGRIQNYETQLAAKRGEGKRKLGYAGQLIDNLKLMTAGASDDEIKKKFEVFDNEIVHAMEHKRPVQDAEGKTYYVDEDQAKDFEADVASMRKQQMQLGEARLSAFKAEIEKTNQALGGKLFPITQYFQQASELLNERAKNGLTDPPSMDEYWSLAQQLMTKHALQIQMETAAKNGTDAAPAAATPPAPTGPKPYSSLSPEERNAAAKTYNDAVTANPNAYDAGIQALRQAGVAVDVKKDLVDGLLPVQGSPLNEVGKKIEQGEKGAKKVLESPDTHTEEELAQARATLKAVNQDKNKFGRLNKLLVEYPKATEQDGWLMAYNKLSSQLGGRPGRVSVEDMDPRKSADELRSQALKKQEVANKLEVLQWLGERNGWRYTPDAARGAAKRLRGE